MLKYTLEQRLEIGRQIYMGEISRFTAAEKYGLGADSTRDYMRLYRDMNALPPRNRTFKQVTRKGGVTIGYRDFDSMSRTELIAEIVKLRGIVEEGA